MSQNKTIIQGLEPHNPNSSNQGGEGTSSFYTRSSQPSARGTVVPGMQRYNQPMADEGGSYQRNAVQQPSQQRNVQCGKPIVGFLYSVSRTMAGEFWPLHIGRNTIGQNLTSDIVLSEATVSTDHAVMVIRQLKNTGAIIAAITDTQSTNGTMINNETIGFSAVECHNGDIITIGNNYECVLLLVDVSKYGLAPVDGFISVETDEKDDDHYYDDAPHFDNGSTRPGGGFNPYDDGPSWQGTANGGGYVPNDGTVGLDGSTTGSPHGGTIPM